MIRFFRMLLMVKDQTQASLKKKKQSQMFVQQIVCFQAALTAAF